MSDMRKLMNIVEGKQLNEEAILASNVKTIQIEANPAGIMQAVLYLVNPDNYQNNSTVGDNGLMSFTNEEEFERTTKILKQFGVKFKEQNVNNADTTFNNPENTRSPYPGNISGSV